MLQSSADVAAESGGALLPHGTHTSPVPTSLLPTPLMTV